MSALPNSILLTIREFAAAARVHPKTIRRGIKAGTWPAPVPGMKKPLKWPRATVARFLGIDTNPNAGT
jgi:hypothetical protein